MSSDPPGLDLDRIAALAAEHGLLLRGAFHPRPEDAVPDRADGRQAGTLVLLGFAGRSGWPAFAGSPEAVDGDADPLDRWSQRVVGDVAQRLDALALFPFGGPPWHPFQRWAQRADTVTPSPLGLSIHPDFGLWHSYRGALVLADRLALPARPAPQPPCPACTARPCLDACPVGAFRPGHYDVAACRSHVSGPDGEACAHGCLARRACPVGRDQAYGAGQAAFLMAAFRRTALPVTAPSDGAAGPSASVERAEGKY